MKTKTLKISVTAKDIKNGSIGSNTFCPIALAVKRKTHRKVNVSANIIDIKKGSSYHLPNKARLFIHNFDEKQSVKPITFIAELIE